MGPSSTHNWGNNQTNALHKFPLNSSQENVSYFNGPGLTSLSNLPRGREGGREAVKFQENLNLRLTLFSFRNKNWELFMIQFWEKLKYLIRISDNLTFLYELAQFNNHGTSHKSDSSHSTWHQTLCLTWLPVLGKLFFLLIFTFIRKLYYET